MVWHGETTVWSIRPVVLVDVSLPNMRQMTSGSRRDEMVGDPKIHEIKICGGLRTSSSIGRFWQGSRFDKPSLSLLHDLQIVEDPGATRS